MIKRLAALTRRRRERPSSGQALVEFSLVFVLFLTIFMGVVEFGSAFAVRLQLSFASREAAVTASESGGSPSTADGAVLNGIDRDIMVPANKSLIDHVDIFWANSDGSVNGGAIERYTPGGALYPGWGGWTQTLNLYPGTSRCAYIGGVSAGCQTGHTGPDLLGVTIVYKYSWITPVPNLVTLLGTGLTFTQTNLSVMEPIPAI
jgi:hypothetical protein